MHLSEIPLVFGSYTQGYWAQNITQTPIVSDTPKTKELTIESAVVTKCDENTNKKP